MVPSKPSALEKPASWELGLAEVGFELRVGGGGGV